jgi:hypothetical protein
LIWWNRNFQTLRAREKHVAFLRHERCIHRHLNSFNRRCTIDRSNADLRRVRYRRKSTIGNVKIWPYLRRCCLWIGTKSWVWGQTICDRLRRSIKCTRIRAPPWLDAVNQSSWIFFRPFCVNSVNTAMLQAFHKRHSTTVGVELGGFDGGN